MLATQASNARAQSETDDVKNACLLAHEHAQVARKASRFSEARTQLRACKAETCPALVRSDCVTWLADLEKIYPAVVFDAFVDGTQALGARVSLDGEQIADGIDGRSVPIDPGRHLVRIEVPGFPPNEQIVVVPEGEHRIVSAAFTRAQSNTPEQSNLSDRGAASIAFRPIPLSVWVAGGLAVAAAASTTVFGVLALSEKNRLTSSCAPFCNSDELASLHQDMLAADVSLGAMVVSTLAAAVFFITRSSIDHRAALPSSSSGPGPRASLSLAPF